MATALHHHSWKGARGMESGFKWSRLGRAILTCDPSLAEVLVGGFLMSMRGLTLMVDGFAYPVVTDLLAQIGATPDRLGALLLMVGLGQVLGTATTRYRGRAAIAAFGSFCCAVGFLGYWGADLLHTGIGRMWGALMLAEFGLAWRIWLTHQIKNGG